MGIEVRHSPNVKLAGNVAAQAGAGRARREDEQQARAAAERRAAQEAQIQAQYERDLMQAEIQAQRDQDQFERTKEMDAINFQQQNEMFQKQGVQRANEAEAAFDRQLETIDYTYTAKEKAENAKIDQKIDWVEQNPRYTREEKDQMIAQLQGIKKPPTGKPDDVQKEIDTFIRPGEVGGVKGFYQRTQNGWEFKPHKIPDPPDVAKIYADAVKSLTRKSNEGADIPPKKSEVLAHVREIIALQRELQKELEQDAPSENVPSGAPTREQQEARALAESFGVQFQGETPADLSVVAEDLKKTDVRAMTKKHGFKLDDLSVVPADANTTQSQRESQKEMEQGGLSRDLDDAGEPVDPTHPDSPAPEPVKPAQVWAKLPAAQQKDIMAQRDALAARMERALKAGDVKTVEEIKQQAAELLRTIR